MNHIFFKIKWVVIFFCAVVTHYSVAQRKIIEKNSTITLRNQGTIFNEQKLVGYYQFYEFQKIDNDNIEYLIKILDHNLNEVFSEKFIEFRIFELKEVSFNNQSFLFKFDSNSFTIGSRRFYIYDQSKKLRRVEFPNGKHEKLWNNQQLVNLPDNIDRSLYSIPDKGFLHFGNIKPKTLLLSLIDSKGAVLWENEEPDGKNEYRTVHVLATHKTKIICLKNVISEYGTYNGQFGNNITQFITIYDIQTGKKENEVKLEDENYKYQVLSNEINTNSTQEILGVFYGKNEKIDNAHAQGLFSANISSDGILTNVKRTTHSDYLRKSLPVANYKTEEEIKSLYFHKVFRVKDKIFAVAENFWLQNNSGKLALRLIGANTSMYDFTMKDIFIFRLNNDFTFEKLDVFEKEKTKFNLPAGYGLFGLPKLANIVKRDNAFDYLFTQIDENENQFIVNHRSAEKEGEVDTYSVKSIIYNSGTFSNDMIRLNTEESILLVPMPSAKFGNVLLSGYVKGEKRIEMRIEKINY